MKERWTIRLGRFRPGLVAGLSILAGCIDDAVQRPDVTRPPQSTSVLIGTRIPQVAPLPGREGYIGLTPLLERATVWAMGETATWYTYGGFHDGMDLAFRRDADHLVWLGRPPRREPDLDPGPWLLVESDRVGNVVRTIPLSELTASHVHGMTVDADGRIVILERGSGQPTETLVRVDPTGGVQRIPLTFSERVHTRWLTWDGTAVVARLRTAGADSSRFERLSPDGSSHVVTVPHDFTVLEVSPDGWHALITNVLMDGLLDLTTGEVTPLVPRPAGPTRWLPQGIIGQWDDEDGPAWHLYDLDAETWIRGAAPPSASMVPGRDEDTPPLFTESEVGRVRIVVTHPDPEVSWAAPDWIPGKVAIIDACPLDGTVAIYGEDGESIRLVGPHRDDLVPMDQDVLDLRFRPDGALAVLTTAFGRYSLLLIPHGSSTVTPGWTIDLRAHFSSTLGWDPTSRRTILAFRGRQYEFEVLLISEEGETELGLRRTGLLMDVSAGRDPTSALLGPLAIYEDLEGRLLIEPADGASSSPRILVPGQPQKLDAVALSPVDHGLLMAGRTAFDGPVISYIELLHPTGLTAPDATRSAPSRRTAGALPSFGFSVGSLR